MSSRLQQLPAPVLQQQALLSKSHGRMELPKAVGGSTDAITSLAPSKMVVPKPTLMRTRALAVRVMLWILWACWQLTLKLGSAAQQLLLKPLLGLVLQLPSLLLALRARLLSTKLGRWLVGGLLSIACISLVCNTKDEQPAGDEQPAPGAAHAKGVDVSASVSLLFDSIRFRTQLQLAFPSWINKLLSRGTRRQDGTIQAAHDPGTTTSGSHRDGTTSGQQSRDWQVLCSQELTRTILQFLEAQQQAAAAAPPAFKICSPRKAGSDGTLSMQGSPRPTPHATPHAADDTSGISRAASGQTVDASIWAAAAADDGLSTLPPPHHTAAATTPGSAPGLSPAGSEPSSSTIPGPDAAVPKAEGSSRVAEPWHARFARVSVDRYKSVSHKSSRAGSPAAGTHALPPGTTCCDNTVIGYQGSSSSSSLEQPDGQHQGGVSSSHSIARRPFPDSITVPVRSRAASVAGEQSPVEIAQPSRPAAAAAGTASPAAGGSCQVPSSSVISQSVLELLQEGLSPAVVAAASLPGGPSLGCAGGEWQQQVQQDCAHSSRLVDASCSPGQVTGRVRALLTAPGQSGGAGLGADGSTCLPGASTPPHGSPAAGSRSRPRVSSASITSVNMGGRLDDLLPGGHHGSSISSPGDMGLLAAGLEREPPQSPSPVEDLSQPGHRSRSSSSLRSGSTSQYSTPVSTVSSVKSGLNRKQSSGVGSTPGRRSSKPRVEVEDLPLRSWEYRGVMF